MAIALLTGLSFARFSRPTAKVMFSKFAVVMPFPEVFAGGDCTVMEQPKLTEEYFNLLTAPRKELI